MFRFGGARGARLAVLVEVCAERFTRYVSRCQHGAKRVAWRCALRTCLPHNLSDVDVSTVARQAHLNFVIGLCGVALVLVAAIGVHLKTVELPRRAKALRKDVIHKYA